ncbi:MAG TPA: hypothetical protein VFT74_15730 [Isosphaeraceae bacterium]|nr:hypothetical protein [Isosphaeraceae bacterium]
MARTNRRKGVIRATILLILAPSVLALSSSWWPGQDGQPPRAADLSRAVLMHARLRSWLELAVVMLQVLAVGSLILARLVPGERWPRSGQTLFAGSMLALGVVGTVCAGYASPFALFAGATMAVLLNVSFLGAGPEHASRAQAEARAA